MYAGNAQEFLAALDAADPRSPEGFYRVKAEQIWPDIDPYLMTRTELDEQIKAGIKLYEKYFPQKSGLGLFETILIVAAVAAVGVWAAGAASAAGGAASAAAQGTAASSAAAAANTSAALAAGGPMGGAWAAGAATATGTVATGTAATVGSQAFSMAKSAAPYVSKIAPLAKATGMKEADKLANAANIIQGSPNATKAAAGIFKMELKRRGMEYVNDKQAEAALRARMKQEQGSYAAWMRREAKRRQDMDPEIQTTAQSNVMSWLPIATPFVIYMLTR